MSNRKLSTLLLLALLGMHTLAGGIPDSMTCNHGAIDNPQPEIMEIDEDIDTEGRLLAGTAPQFRIYGYYGLVEQHTDTADYLYISEKLMPPVIDYYSAALRVRSPVSGLWKTSSSKVCSASTPAALKKGVAADFIYVVTTAKTTSYVANTYTCLMAGGTRRPLAGQTTISSDFVRATTDVLVHEKNMICMIHELTHALGMSTSMYPHFINPTTGKTLTGHILHETLDGATSLVLNLAPLTQRLQSYYGCSSLKGAYMENSGSAATAGSHFERKIFSYEMMTSGLVFQQQISQFTLALLEGSGWFLPNYEYADQFSFGQGQGCNFSFQKCPSTQFSEYCSGSSRKCTHMGRGGGTCTSDTRADSCRWVIGNEGYDCGNANYKKYSRLPSVEVWGRGDGSKCFEGTLETGKKAGSSTTFCFKPTCSGTGSSTKLTIAIGKTSVVCTAKGAKTVSGYAGVIDCPDPITFCSTVGAAVCPRNCMGRGTCVNGKCQCNKGATGEDCALVA